MVMSAEKSLHSTNCPILHLNTNISDQNKPRWSFSREENKASISKHTLQTNFKLWRFWSDMNTDSAQKRPIRDLECRGIYSVFLCD